MPLNESVHIHADIVQGSDDWHKLRRCRVGGTKASVLFTEPSAKSAENGEVLGKGAIDLAYSIASQMLSLQRPVDPYANVRPMSEAMERGVLLEPFARTQYEVQQVVEVMEVGYVSHEELVTVGFSPDGVIIISEDEIGLVEIKCPMGPEFLRVLNTGEIKPNYIKQMQWGLWVTGGLWCDMYTYHPDSRVCSNIRFERDEEMMSRLDVAVPAFEALVKSAVIAGGGTWIGN